MLLLSPVSNFHCNLTPCVRILKIDIGTLSYQGSGQMPEACLAFVGAVIDRNYEKTDKAVNTALGLLDHPERKSA